MWLGRFLKENSSFWLWNAPLLWRSPTEPISRPKGKDRKKKKKPWEKERSLLFYLFHLTQIHLQIQKTFQHGQRGRLGTQTTCCHAHCFHGVPAQFPANSMLSSTFKHIKMNNRHQRDHSSQTFLSDHLKLLLQTGKAGRHSFNGKKP